jgi:hypothetical protein
MFLFGGAFQPQQRISRAFLQSAAEQDAREPASPTAWETKIARLVGRAPKFLPQTFRLVIGPTIEERHINARLSAIGCKLDRGFHVAVALSTLVVPRPVALNELRGRPLSKWLAAEQRLRTLIRQFSGQILGLVGRQGGVM